MTDLILSTSLDAGLYINPIKIGVVIILFLGWAACAQWVDRDTNVVKTKREQWNVIIISGASVSTFVLLVIPIWQGSMFPVGIAIWLLLCGAPVMAYIMHRNGRVVANRRVLTIGHLKRMLGGGGRKKAARGKTLRVQIYNHEGKFVEIPEDYEESLAYNDLQDFLHDLLWRRASDAEMVSDKERFQLVYRIDGVSIKHEEGLPLENGERVLKFLKKISGLKVDEVRKPQTGAIEVALLSHEGAPDKAEVTTSGTTAGEKLSIRMHAKTKLLRLTELGMAPQRVEAFKKLLSKKHGLILLSAPRENGLTTSQYAVLKSHDAYMNHIHSLERRPLMEVDNVTQQVYEGANTDVNYARMLQTVLHREPDIVLVGECEDRETAMISSRAAADGRKIYLGCEADDSFEALAKYLKYASEPTLAARSLLGVLGQRLVRILCEDCREAFEPDSATLKKLNLPADKIEHFFRPPTYEEDGKKKKICTKCQGSGYYGRTGIFELLVIDSTIRALIAAGSPINKIKAQCRKNRMYYLQEEGLLKVIDGTTSMTEVLRCLSNNRP